MSRTAEDIIEIGRDLIVVREAMPGTFLEWIEAEFSMGKSTAYKFIQAAENVGDRLPPDGSLPTTVLYALASPSTPAPRAARAVAVGITTISRTSWTADGIDG